MDRDQGSRWHGSVTKVELSATFLFFAIAVGYPVWRGLLDPQPEVDFRFYWFAGYMWAHGLDPYSSAFHQMGTQLVPTGNGLEYWLYPPNWWIVSRCLAAFDLATAIIVWRLTSTAILIASTGAVVAALAQEQPLPRRLMIVSGACALATTIEATGNALINGQVSPILVYLGLTLIVLSQLRRSPLLMAIGLVLVSLKPQIGLTVYLAVAFAVEWRKPLLIALVSDLVLASPQFLSFGAVTTAREWAYNLSKWGRLGGNEILTGPGHFVARLGGSFPVGAQFALATLTAVAAGMLYRRDPRSLAATTILIAGVAAFAPLHTYDMPLLVLLTCMIWKLEENRICQAVLAAALILILRPTRLEAMLGITFYDYGAGVLTLSLAAFLLLAVAIHVAWSHRCSNRRRTEPPSPALC